MARPLRAPRDSDLALVRFGDLGAPVWDGGRDDHGIGAAGLGRNLMQTHRWISAAVQVYGMGPDTPALIVGEARDPDAVAVLGPRPGGAYRLLGGPEIGEAVEVLWRDAAALEALARGLAGLGVAIDFGHYPVAPGLGDLLARALGWRGIVLRRTLPQRAMPVLDLTPAWQDPLAQFGRSRRQSLRRKRRKAEAMGAVETQVLAPDAAGFDALFDRFAAVEAQSWKGSAGTALRHDADQRAFFAAFGRAMAACGALRLSFLTIGGRDAAAEFGAVWARRFWSIKLGYDPRFAPVSPGELLRVDLVARAAAKGLEAVEFCGKEAGWTHGWTDAAIEIEALRLYPVTPGGVMGLARDGGAILSRRLADRARRAKRSE